MSEPKRFTLIGEHLVLLRHANVRWDGDEWGAPAIDSKRPYGNSNLLGDLAEILGVEGFVDHEGEKRYSEEQVKTMDRLHAETETALQIVLASGEFTPGVYETSDAYSRDWKRCKPA
jgi:hypothetical protein